MEIHWMVIFTSIVAVLTLLWSLYALKTEKQ